MATTRKEWLNHQSNFTECLIFPYQPMQTNTHTASQLHTQELWAELNQIKFDVWCLTCTVTWVSLLPSYGVACPSVPLWAHAPLRHCSDRTGPVYAPSLLWSQGSRRWNHRWLSLNTFKIKPGSHWGIK